MEDLIPILVVLAWLVFGFLGKLLSGRKRPSVPATGAEAKKPSSFDQVLREMMREAGLEPPAQEASPPPRRPMPPPPPPPRTVPPRRVPPLPAAAWTASEHVQTLAEHQRGDAMPLGPSLPAVVDRGERSRFATGVLADLREPRSLARALVLREILGPPVALRGSDEGR